jgi:hypothetical protein
LKVTHGVKSSFVDKSFMLGLSAQHANLKKIGIHQMATPSTTVIKEKVQDNLIGNVSVIYNHLKKDYCNALFITIFFYS